MSPAAVAGYLEMRGYRDFAVTITEAWLYNAVDWRPLAKYGPCVLEIFPLANESSTRARDCIEHARAQGYEDVVPAYATYGSHNPALYATNRFGVPGIYSLYTGDDIGPGNWAKWRLTL